MITPTTTTGTRHPVVADRPAPKVGPDGDRSEFITELETIIRNWHKDPVEFDLPAMDAEIDSPGYKFDQLAFVQLMARHWIPGRTAIRCPEFCTKPTGHPFDDGGVRTHSSDPLAVDLESKEDLTLAVEQHEIRDGDDSTMWREPAIVFFQFDGDELPAADARKIASALVAAADQLDAASGIVSAHDDVRGPQ